MLGVPRHARGKGYRGVAERAHRVALLAFTRLQVGHFPLSFTESRTHFAAWAIVSSPLILGLDMADEVCRHKRGAGQGSTFARD